MNNIHVGCGVANERRPVIEALNQKHISTGPLLKSTVNGRVRVAFVLVDQFSSMAMVSMMEPMRIANRVSDADLFSWSTHTINGTHVASSNGSRMAPDGDLDTASSADNIIVCSGVGAHRSPDPTLESWLRRMGRTERVIGGICTGTFILAQAGLLTDHRCSIHWACREALIEIYSNLVVNRDLFSFDRNRLTCAGGTATLDMVLHDIAQRKDGQLAREVSNWLFHETIRYPDDNDFLPTEARVGTSRRPVVRAASMMEEHIESPVSLRSIAAHSGVTIRQLERLFADTLGMSPGQYYRTVRLRRARGLVRMSDLAISEIAVACGYVSSSHFSAAYRRMFGATPSSDRQRSTSRYRNLGA